MSARVGEKGFSLMELLVAIGIMAAIAAVTIPLVTKFVSRGESGAQAKELEHMQTSMRSLMADAALITVDDNSTTAVNAWAGLPTKSTAVIKVNGVATDLTEYMRMTNGKTVYYYCWNTAAVATVHVSAVACP